MSLSQCRTAPGRRSDAKRMLFDELSKTWHQAEAVGVAPVQGADDRQPAEVPQTGRARSIRCGEDDR